MHRRQTKIAVCALRSALLLALGLGLSASRSPAADSPPAASEVRDGQHDFDFTFGRWTVHLKRKVAGTDRWTDSDGYGIYRKVWGGRANLNEFFTESPSGHVEGLTLRTYNPATHQWSLYWANGRDGILSSAQVGQFNHGQGEFYAQDSSDGKSILVRYVWSKITPTSAHFEQAFSEDGGKSWDVNWISDMVRIGDVEEATSSGAGTSNEQPGQRDFEPLLGRWNYHLKRRLKPLTGSTQWIDLTGNGDCTPLWHGRAPCNEDVPFLDEKEVVQQTRGTFLGDYRVRQQQIACKPWPKSVLPTKYRSPVRSSVPTMFVSGDADGGTPLWFMQHAATGFAERVEIVAGGQGHTEWSDCIARLYRRFVGDGSTRELMGATCDSVPRPPFKTE